MRIADAIVKTLLEADEDFDYKDVYSLNADDEFVAAVEQAMPELKAREIVKIGNFTIRLNNYRDRWVFTLSFDYVDPLHGSFMRKWTWNERRNFTAMLRETAARAFMAAQPEYERQQAIVALNKRAEAIRARDPNGFDAWINALPDTGHTQYADMTLGDVAFWQNLLRDR